MLQRQSAKRCGAQSQVGEAADAVVSYLHLLHMVPSLWRRIECTNEHLIDREALVLASGRLLPPLLALALALAAVLASMIRVGGVQA